MIEQISRFFPKKKAAFFHFLFALCVFAWLTLQPYMQQWITYQTHGQLLDSLSVHVDSFTEQQMRVLHGGQAFYASLSAPSFFLSLDQTSYAFWSVGWIFFAFVSAICVWLEKKSAQIFALISVFFAVLALLASFDKVAPPSDLYPTKNDIFNHYVQEKETQVFSQKENLLRGWHRYLVVQWSKELPSADPAIFKQQLTKGLVLFNLHRVEKLTKGEDPQLLLQGFLKAPSFFTHLMILLWNIGFAWILFQKMHELKPISPVRS